MNVKNNYNIVIYIYYKNLGTTKDNGGCKDLEYFCNNYNSEISCVINLVKKIDCIWFDG